MPLPTPPLIRDAEFDREFDRELERNRRLLELARHNGYELDLFERADLKGLWWSIPLGFYPIARCMAMRVA